MHVIVQTRKLRELLVIVEEIIVGNLCHRECH